MILIINNALSGLQPPYLIIIMKYPLTSVWNTQKQSFLQNLRPEFSGRYGLAADPPWAFSQHSFHLTFHFAAKGVLANWKLCLSADRIDYPVCLKYKMQKKENKSKGDRLFYMGLFFCPKHKLLKQYSRQVALPFQKLAQKCYFAINNQIAFTFQCQLLNNYRVGEHHENWLQFLRQLRPWGLILCNYQKVNIHSDLPCAHSENKAVRLEECSGWQRSPMLS